MMQSIGLGVLLVIWCGIGLWCMVSDVRKRRDVTVLDLAFMACVSFSGPVVGLVLLLTRFDDRVIIKRREPKLDAEKLAITIACLLFSTTLSAAEPIRPQWQQSRFASPLMTATVRFNFTPIQGGKFDWQCEVPDRWSGSDESGDWKIFLQEITFILVDENYREVSRCLELKTVKAYTRFNHPERNIILNGFWGPSDFKTKSFEQALRRLQKQTEARAGGVQVTTEITSPCETVNVYRVWIGIPSV